jgi:hypothetical protein
MDWHLLKPWAQINLFRNFLTSICHSDEKYNILSIKLLKSLEHAYLPSFFPSLFCFLGQIKW